VIFHRPTSEGGQEGQGREQEQEEQGQEQEQEQGQGHTVFFDPDAYHIESVGGILYHRFHTYMTAWQRGYYSSTSGGLSILGNKS
jgi:hypothetical protein